MSNAEFSTQDAHEILTREFTDRYLARMGVSAIAHSIAYDEENPVCDYERTSWEARPNRLSESVGKLVLGKAHGISGKQFDADFAAPFAQKGAEIDHALREHPVMLINGHHKDLQAALALLAATVGVARANSQGRYQRDLQDMINVSHGIATRGFVPVEFGLKKPHVALPFLRMQQLIINPHLSFPINQKMIESGIPESFRKDYNARLRAGCIAAATAATNHPRGYHTLWTLSPSGTPDVPQEDRLVTKKIEPATTRLIEQMGCGLLPVFTSFAKGQRPNLTLGNVIPPNEVDSQTVPNIMQNLAEYRREHGESNVYYESE